MLRGASDVYNLGKSADKLLGIHFVPPVASYSIKYVNCQVQEICRKNSETRNRGRESIIHCLAVASQEELAG